MTLHGYEVEPVTLNESIERGYSSLFGKTRKEQRILYNVRPKETGPKKRRTNNGINQKIS